MAPTKAASKSTPAKKPATTTGKKDALEVRKPAALATANASDLLLQDAGAGLEDMSAQDLQIPRISILQANSPQVKKSDGKYVKGAEEGDFFDNVANAVYAKGDKGFLFIPVARRRANIEWIPKDAGGGFIADHGANDAILSQCTKDDKNRMMLKNGHEVVTTQEYYIIALDADGKNPKQAVISMAKTQLKKARKMNTVLSSLQVARPDGKGTFNPALFYSVFHATTVPESKDTFNWMGWLCPRHGDTLELPQGNDLYIAARQFRESVNIGAVKVATPAAEEISGGGGEGSPEDNETL
jgi:hypothetical protein